MITNGVIVILSVEDLGICNNERKDSYITLFVKEFGKEDNKFRMTAYGSTAEYIARNIITEDGNPYVDDKGIAGYCQRVSKEERKANKVKIHGRRAFLSGEIEISFIKRDVTGVKTVIKNGVATNYQMTIVAEVPSTTVRCTSVQFIDKKADNSGNVIDASGDEIDYEELADGVVEGDIAGTIGDETSGSSNFVIEKQSNESKGRERTSKLQGR